ncbi:hypothetical protein Aduo_009062 [Ancylostoma duodenale]
MSSSDCFIHRPYLYYADEPGPNLHNQLRAAAQSQPLYVQPSESRQSNHNHHVSDPYRNYELPSGSGQSNHSDSGPLDGPGNRHLQVYAAETNEGWADPITREELKQSAPPRSREEIHYYGEREVEKSTQDPEVIGHSCVPIPKGNDKANRVTAQPHNPESNLAPTQSYWHGIVDKVKRMNWEDAERGDKVLRYFVKRGYDARRSAHLRSKRDDSVHMEEGQLYTLDGVCREVEVPLLFALVRHKREQDYVIIFGSMKEALELANTEDDFEIQIVLDFEQAAINAARRIFPEFLVQGCLWHLSQGQLCVLIIEWRQMVKGLPILPREHLDQWMRITPLITHVGDS